MENELDLIDRRILYELDLDARQSASQIAKKLRISKETANFRVKRLLKNNLIKGFYPIIDNSKIGKTFFKIFIKFKEIPTSKKKEILDFISNYPGMSQVLLLEGNYHVQLFFLASSNSDLLRLIEDMNNSFGQEIKEREVLIVDSIYRFTNKFLYSGHGKTSVSSSNNSLAKLDKLDWKILSEISKYARISILELSEKLDITPQLTQYHLKKLIKNKIIISTHLAINYNQINKQHYHLTFQVSNHKMLDEMIDFFNTTNKCIFATKMIGRYDCSAEIICDNNKELHELTSIFANKFHNSLNFLDVFLIYDEYELNLYPIESDN